MTREIPLSDGSIALVDDEDFDLVSVHRWYPVRSRTSDTVYAATSVYQPDKPLFSLRMHRVILGAPPRVRVDHRDGDGLNNLRTNIRIGTDSQNRQNERNRRTDKHAKGVYRVKGRWAAGIGVNYQRIYLGLFEHHDDAARAYDEAALRYFGDFAAPNYVPPALELSYRTHAAFFSQELRRVAPARRFEALTSSAQPDVVVFRPVPKSGSDVLELNESSGQIAGRHLVDLLKTRGWEHGSHPARTVDGVVVVERKVSVPA